MDDLIFEMGQPNEILSCPEWTEWWAVDETGLHLEYAPGYEPENKMKYLQERYEDVFGDLDENYANNLYTESDIDLFSSEYAQTPFPISTTSVDYDNWPSEYLEYLRDMIDEYNPTNADWRQELSELRAEQPNTDPEEQVVELQSTDGLILPS